MRHTCTAACLLTHLHAVDVPLLARHFVALVRAPVREPGREIRADCSVQQRAGGVVHGLRRAQQERGCVYVCGCVCVFGCVYGCMRACVCLRELCVGTPLQAPFPLRNECLPPHTHPQCAHLPPTPRPSTRTQARRARTLDSLTMSASRAASTLHVCWSPTTGGPTCRASAMSCTEARDGSQISGIMP